MQQYDNTSENFFHLFQSLSWMRGEQFRRVVSRVEGPDVLDLGCGFTGYYWAMGYAHKANSISFYDVVPENIEALTNYIEMLSPEDVEANFSETIEFLRDESIIPANMSAEEIVENLISKTADIQVFDFLSDQTNQAFDTVMALQAIEINDTYEEFVQSLNNVKTMLKPGGQFIGIILPYDEVLPITADEIAIRKEGRLNPKYDDVVKAFKESDLELSEIDTFDTKQYNYRTAIVFRAA